MKIKKDYYKGITSPYFFGLVQEIISIGNLRSANKILDFGCGNGNLKSILKNKNIVGYDIKKDLSEVTDWRKVDFDIIVAHEVFYCMSATELMLFLDILKGKNKNVEIVFSVSRMNTLGKILKFISNNEDAWEDTQLTPLEQLLIIQEQCIIKKHTSKFMMVDFYVAKFKNGNA